MMEGEGGAAPVNVRIRDGRRISVYRSYVYPVLDQPNLTVLTGALVTKLILEGRRVSGVEIVHDQAVRRIGCVHEVVLSLGAINTPKVLMQSGIGDETELARVGIDVIQHLPGVGQNLQEHIRVGACAWEYPRPEQWFAGLTEATIFWKSEPGLQVPDLQIFSNEGVALGDRVTIDDPAAKVWSLAAGVVRTQSRGPLAADGRRPERCHRH
jgi:choline dehydrogenase